MSSEALRIPNHSLSLADLISFHTRTSPNPSRHQLQWQSGPSSLGHARVAVHLPKVQAQLVLKGGGRLLQHPDAQQGGGWKEGTTCKSDGQ